MANTWPVYSPEELAKASKNWQKPWHENFLVMFSSFWGGFSKNPAMWGIPPDDHMVHRGDGVFEAFKCVNGRAYCLSEHLDRLQKSASFIDLKMPPSFTQITDIVKQAFHLTGDVDQTMRLTISRGPGGFAANPYESPESQLYLVSIKLKRPNAEVYEKGVSLATTPFPSKAEYSEIKSCNYLHNVLAKKAAIDAGADFAVSFDREGYLTEGATENVAVITKDRELLVPSFSRILKGVTLSRVMAQGQDLVREGLLHSVANRDLTQKEVRNQASEIILTTSSFDVLSVVKWDGQDIGNGRPGPIAPELRARIDREIHGDNPQTTIL